MKQFLSLAIDNRLKELTLETISSLRFPVLEIEGLEKILFMRFALDSLKESAQPIYGEAELQTVRGFEIISYSKLNTGSNFRLFDGWPKEEVVGPGHIEKRWNQPASADRWKTIFMPEKMVRVEFIRVFSEQEFERIMLGISPLSMDVKWYVYFESGHLYCHRSWTGICIFDVSLETIGNETIITQVSVNNDEEQRAYSSLGDLASILDQLTYEAKELYS